MQLIFNTQYFNNTMSSLNYDAQKLPLGKLSKATITRGYQTLKDLSALIDDPALAANYGTSHPQAIEHLSNTFYSLIPHAFGRNRPPIIRDQSMVKKEVELLESLSDMKDAALIMKMEKVADDDVHPLDRQYQGLKMEEMTPLDPTSNEYTQLQNYLLESRGATHGHQYAVESIFRIERQGERERFESSSFGKMDQNRRLLWHGSRCTNFGGILSQVILSILIHSCFFPLYFPFLPFNTPFFFVLLLFRLCFSGPFQCQHAVFYSCPFLMPLLTMPCL